MDIGCLACTGRHHEPTLLAEASLLWGEQRSSKTIVAEVVVVRKRRRGKRERDGTLRRRGRQVISVNGVVDDGRGRWASNGVATTGELSPAFYRRAMELPCRRCGAKPAVVLERLRPALLAGHASVLVGSKGELLLGSTGASSSVPPRREDARKSRPVRSR
jgi:hypothetical protein